MDAVDRKQVQDELDTYFESDSKKIARMALFLIRALGRVLASTDLRPGPELKAALNEALLYANAPLGRPDRRIVELLRDLLIAELAESLGIESYEDE